MTTLRAIGILGLALATSLAGFAQDPQTTIRVTTRVIELSVVVTENGAPVRGLTRNDFELLDSDEPREIAFFSEELTADRPPNQQLPPNAFSNRMAAASGVQNVTVILLDALNTEIQNQAYARKQILEFLEQIQPEDRVAIFVLGQELHVLHDFTTDASSLVAALEQYRGRAATELRASQLPEDRNRISRIEADQQEYMEQYAGGDESASSGSVLDRIFREFLQAANRRAPDFYARQRGLWAARALTNIGRYLAAVPGRKNLIWVSSSFPFAVGLEDALDSGRMAREGFNFRDEIEQAARALNEGNVAIYPVDARGLAGASAFDAQATRFPVGTRGRGLPSFSPAPPNLDNMHVLAKKTGGKAFYNTNDIRTAVRTAIDDAAGTYTLGFYLPSEDLDDKFHNLKVRVKRKGVDVRHREGYLALADESFNKEQRTEEIRYLLHGPVDSTEIGLDVRKELDGTAPDSPVKLMIRVAVEGITLEQDGDRRKGKVEIIIAQNNVKGETLQVDSQTVDLNLTEDNYKKVAGSGGMLLWKTVTPKPEIAEFRIVVVDHPRSLIGSLHVPHAIQPAP